MAKEAKTRRLCSEIQLFDLCDKERCNFKDGRYCTNEEVLGKFEAVVDEDDGTAEQFVGGELEQAEGDDDDLDYAEEEYYEEEFQEPDEEEDF